MTEEINDPNKGDSIASWLDLIYRYGLPGAFAVWLLFVFLAEQPKMRDSIDHMNTVLTQHENDQQDRFKTIILQLEQMRQELNYDEAILRAICFSVVAQGDKSAQLHCQPLFMKEATP